MKNKNNNMKKLIINNKNLMIHYNHIEILSKKICDIGSQGVRSANLC
jgi:hypothetical protein